MKTQCVEETLKHIHHKQHTKGSSSEDSVTNEGGEPVHVKSRKGFFTIKDIPDK